MSNYKTLFLMRLLKSLIDSFVDTFLVLYFLEVSNDNIITLGSYQLVYVAVVYLIIYACRNFAKTRHRITLMRIAMILDILFFVSIMILKGEIANYAYFVGLLRGLEEGFYYSVFNMVENDGISNTERNRYVGSYLAVSSLAAIAFPAIFGSIIQSNGFIPTLSIILAIVGVRLLLSFVFRDTNLPRIKHADLKKYRELTHKDRRFYWMNLAHFFDGITFSASAFSYVVTIYIVQVFSTSFSLGIFTSLFGIISSLIGIAFAKLFKKRHYPPLIAISAIATIITLFVMILNCNAITIIVFNFCQTVYKRVAHVINEANGGNLCNSPKIRRNYKMEYWITTERYYVSGRVVSILLFILTAFTPDIIPIMLIFSLALAAFAFSSLQLQRAIAKKGSSPKSPSRHAYAFRRIDSSD